MEEEILRSNPVEEEENLTDVVVTATSCKRYVEKEENHEQMAMTPITLYRTPSVFRFGKTICTSDQLLCYALKGGNHRIVNKFSANSHLFKGHKMNCTDMLLTSSKSGVLMVSASEYNDLLVAQVSEGVKKSKDINIQLRAALKFADKEVYFTRLVQSPKSPLTLFCLTNTNVIYEVDLETHLKEKQPLESLKYSEFRVGKKLGIRLLLDLSGGDDLRDLLVSSDGKLLSMGNDQGVVKVYQRNDEGDFKLWKNWVAVNGPVCSMSFVGSNNLLVGGERNRVLCMWYISGEGVELVDVFEWKGEITGGKANLVDVLESNTHVIVGSMMNPLMCFISIENDEEGKAKFSCLKLYNTLYPAVSLCSLVKPVGQVLMIGIFVVQTDKIQLMHISNKELCQDVQKIESVDLPLCVTFSKMEESEEKGEEKESETPMFNIPDESSVEVAEVQFTPQDQVEDEMVEKEPSVRILQRTAEGDKDGVDNVVQVGGVEEGEGEGEFLQETEVVPEIPEVELIPKKESSETVGNEQEINISVQEFEKQFDSSEKAGEEMQTPETIVDSPESVDTMERVESVSVETGVELEAKSVNGMERRILSRMQEVVFNLHQQFEKERVERQAKQDEHQKQLLQVVSKTVIHEIPTAVTNLFNKKIQEMIPTVTELTNVHLNRVMLKNVTKMERDIKRSINEQFSQFEKSMKKSNQTLIHNRVVGQFEQLSRKMESSFRNVVSKNDVKEIVQRVVEKQMKVIGTQIAKSVTREVAKIGEKISQSGTPSKPFPEKEVVMLLKNNKIEEAIKKVLAFRNLKWLTWFLKKVNPVCLDQYSPNPVEIGAETCLALIQQISVDMSQDSKLKCSWLSSCLMRVDFENENVKPYVGQVIPAALKSVIAVHEKTPSRESHVCLLALKSRMHV